MSHRRIILIICALLVVILAWGSLANAGATMSWDFEFFDNPNARQVALNIANRQRELAKEDDELSAVERFKESLERQIINRAIREIVESIFDPDAELDEGWYQVGDDIIQFYRDENGNMVVIYTDAAGNTTEIVITRDLY